VPYELPPEWATAWQSVILGPNTRRAAGRLVLPQPWMQPALWAP
jgi:putative acetyltransferase